MASLKYLLLMILYITSSSLTQKLKIEQIKGIDNIKIDDTQSQTLRNYIESNEKLLVLFYSTHCKYSQSLLIELQKAIAFLNGFIYFPKKSNCKADGDKNCLDITFTQIDIFNQKDLASQMNKSKIVEQTPLVRLYNKGKVVSTYEGTRTAISLINYIADIFFPSTNIFTIMSVEDFISFNKFTPSVIFISENNSLPFLIKDVKNINEELVYAHLSLSDWEDYNKQIKEDISLDFSQGKEFAILRTEDGVFHTALKSAESNQSILEKFLLKNLYSVMHFNEDTAKHIFSHHKPGLFFYLTPKNHSKYYKEIIEGIQTTDITKQVLVYVLGHPDNESFEGRLYSLIKASHKDFPSVKIHYKKDTLETYSLPLDLEEGIKFDEIKKFVQNWSNGELSPENREELKYESHEKDDL